MATSLEGTCSSSSLFRALRAYTENSDLGKSLDEAGPSSSNVRATAPAVAHTVDCSPEREVAASFESIIREIDGTSKSLAIPTFFKPVGEAWVSHADEVAHLLLPPSEAKAGHRGEFGEAACPCTERAGAFGF